MLADVGHYGSEQYTIQLIQLVGEKFPYLCRPFDGDRHRPHPLFLTLHDMAKSDVKTAAKKKATSGKNGAETATAKKARPGRVPGGGQS